MGESAEMKCIQYLLLATGVLSAAVGVCFCALCIYDDSLPTADRLTTFVFFATNLIFGAIIVRFALKGIYNPYSNIRRFVFDCFDVLGYLVVINGAAYLLFSFTHGMIVVVLGGLIKYCTLRIREHGEGDYNGVFWLFLSILAGVLFVVMLSSMQGATMLYALDSVADMMLATAMLLAVVLLIDAVRIAPEESPCERDPWRSPSRSTGRSPPPMPRMHPRAYPPRCSWSRPWTGARGPP